MNLQAELLLANDDRDVGQVLYLLANDDRDVGQVRYLLAQILLFTLNELVVFFG